MMKRKNPNLIQLQKSFRGGKSGVILEGSSRSGKTWSGVDFIIWLCASYTGLTINIIRETYNSFKTTLYDDFNRRFSMFCLPGPAVNIKEVATFWLFGNKINFLGADKAAKFEGATCDFAWFNEMLDIHNEIFDQQEQRCRRFWWGDYNPKASDHWLFRKVCNRPDVDFLHTTFDDNPHISRSERRKILSYNPNNDENIKNGTADDYMWSVYGLGLRAAPEGLVFSNYQWVESLPEDVHKVMFGLDLGYTNSPAALMEVRVNGRDLFIKKHIYYPFESAISIAPYLDKAISNKSQHIWVDSADPIFIAQLRQLGFMAIAVKKSPGYKKHMIANLKSYRLHFVNDTDLRRELENYKYRTINGIRLDEPIDDYDHAIDAMIYATMHELRFNV